MIILEFCPPFQVRPSFRKIGVISRVMWGWVGVSYVPCDLNDFIKGMTKAAVTLANEQTERSTEIKKLLGVE